MHEFQKRIFISHSCIKQIIFPGTTNQRPSKQRRKSNHSIQTCDRYETFIITLTCFILSIFCMKRYCTYGYKGVKNVSPGAKGFLWYLCWNSTASKRVYFYVPHEWNIISPYDVVFDDIFSSVLAYTPQPYAEAMSMRKDMSW